MPRIGKLAKCVAFAVDCDEVNEADTVVELEDGVSHS
jgi:hypothetical protein